MYHEDCKNKKDESIKRIFDLAVKLGNDKFAEQVCHYFTQKIDVFNNLLIECPIFRKKTKKLCESDYELFARIFTQLMSEQIRITSNQPEVQNSLCALMAAIKETIDEDQNDEDVDGP